MGAKWIAKAVVQKAISVLPNAQRVNHLFQDRVTRSTTLSEEFLHKRIGWAGEHVAALRRHADPAPGWTGLELGTGWYPIVPLCLFLAGADRVWMVDLEDLGRPELTRQALDGVLAAHAEGRVDDALGPVDPDRVARLRAAVADLDRLGRVEALGLLGLRVRAGDARTLGADVAPHLICSNTVLEHIPADVLEGILATFRSISGPGTVMSHLVDLCDHYAYVDDSVSVYHFLRYSDRAWRVIDNTIQPMNRLRASEYRDLYRRAGVPVTEEALEGCDPLALVGEPLAPRFRQMDPADVACKVSRLVTVF